MTIKPSPPKRCAWRRPTARIREMVMTGTSETQIGASRSLSVAAASSGPWSAAHSPVFSDGRGIPPTAAKRRSVSCVLVISKLTTRTGFFWLMATSAATFMARVVLPMAGRPATTIIWPDFKPWVNLSRSGIPVPSPSMTTPFWKRSRRSCSTSTCSAMMSPIIWHSPSLPDASSPSTMDWAREILSSIAVCSCATSWIRSAAADS